MKYTKIKVDTLSRRQAILWSRDTFGSPLANGAKFHEMRWYHRDLKGKSSLVTTPCFYFKDEKDAVMFALKWA